MKRFFIRQTARAADRTITKSRQMELGLPRRLRRRNTVIPSGVDLTLFKPQPRADARRELGWNNDERVVLFAADPAVELKRYPLAVAACERATRTLPGLRLEVANGVPPQRMPKIMNGADCLLVTSTSEGSPNVVKEALMCNLPIVSTPVGDVAELLEYVTPSYVCEGNEHALATALVSCLIHPRRSNGRERSARLASDAIARCVEAVYTEVLRPGSPANVAVPP